MYVERERNEGCILEYINISEICFMKCIKTPSFHHDKLDGLYKVIILFKNGKEREIFFDNSDEYQDFIRKSK